MNDFLTMVHENFVPSSGREQGNNQQKCQHHLQEHQQQSRRRPRRINCEKAKLLNALGSGSPGGVRTEGRSGGDDEFKDANWDMIPAPPITPPAAFRPSPDSCYRRVATLRKGKEDAWVG